MHIAFKNPACGVFLAHWQGLRREALIPHWRAYSERPPFALLRSTMIFEICAEGLLTRFMGTALTDLWGKDFTGSYLESFVDPEWRASILEDVRRICGHPIGARIAGCTVTSLGREVECESICLPLAVDDGQPCRCVQYCYLAGEFKRDEFKTRFVWSRSPEWIDIGAGVPD